MQASPRNDIKIRNLVDKLSLDLVNETTGKTVFSHTIRRYETVVKNKIGDTLYSNLEDSKELIALTDIAYNGGSVLLGPELRQALTDENRAEAWFQIRYNSNGGQSRINSGKGIANRRVSESDVFGLYDETPSVEGMKDVISMARLHADTITTEESAFPVTPKSSSANPYVEDNGIAHQIQAAKDYLRHNHHTDIQNDLPSNYYTPYIQNDDTQRDHVQIDLSQANPITLVQLMHALPKETLNQAQVSLKENDAIAISKKEELLIEKGDTFQDVQTHSQLSTAVLIAKNPWLVEKGRIQLPEETMVSTHVSNLSIKDQMYYENQENQKASNLTQEQTQEDVQTHGLVKEGTAREELPLANEAETSQAFSMDTVDYNKYLPEHVRQETSYSNEGGMDIA